MLANSLLPALLLPLFLAPPALARRPPQEPPAAARLDAGLLSRVRASERRLPPLLAGLAQWADERRLFRERDRCWAGVLAVDPGDERARRALQYRRIGGDRWWQSPSFHVGRNRGSEEDLADFARHRDAALLGHRRALLEPARDRQHPVAVRHELARRYLRVEPDHKGAHALLGEVWHEDRWLLFESRATLLGRSRLFELAASCVRDTRPHNAHAKDEERAAGLAWRSVQATRRVRVLATSPGAEARETARLAHAAGSLYAQVFGGRSLLRPGFTIYLLSGPEERDRLLDAYGIEGEMRTILQTAAGGWLDFDRSAGRARLLGEWDGRRARRRDGAVRQAMGTLMLDDLWIGARHGWAWEGIGLYLCYRLTGSRETWFFQPGQSGSSLATPLWMQMQSPRSDWFELAGEVLPSLSEDALERLMRTHLNALTDVDLLLSYVLAGYLLEGRPLETPLILKRIGRGAEGAEVLRELLDVEPLLLQQRLLRWLRETRD